MPDTSSISDAAVRWNSVIAVAATGIFAGGGLLIGVIGAGRWLPMDPMVWQQGFWAEFLGFAVAIVPAFMLSFVGIFLSRRADVHMPRARWWWTLALVFWGINCAITSVYHLPVNIQLAGVPFTAAEADSIRTVWLALHVPRVVLAIGTHLACIQAALISAASGKLEARP